MLAATALALLGACGSRSSGRPEVQVRGTDPGLPGVTGTPVASSQGQVLTGGARPDPSGVIVHDGYEAVVAREGDTVQSVADRLALSASELGAYNGLAASHRLTAGDELVLPPRPGGYSSGAKPDTGLGYPATGDTVVTGLPGGSGPIISTPIGGALPPAGGVTTDPLAGGGPAPGEAGWSPTRIAEAIERGAGAPTATTLPDTGTTPLPGVPTPIPNTGTGTPPQILGTLPATGPATGTVATADPVVAATTPPTASAGGARLMRPVDGPVAIGYNQGSGPAKNDGVDFSAPAGTPVVAAESGTVALVSQSLGGLGTIVLIRHDGGLLTVYGRIDRVTVAKGDSVSRGQRIGAVANASAPAEPRMHFEVRRGAESVDPMSYL